MSKGGEGEGSGFSRHTKDDKKVIYCYFLALDIKYMKSQLFINY